MINNKEIKEIFEFALQNHNKNNLKVAEEFYKKVLKIDQNHFKTIFLLGSLSGQIKKFDIAKQLLEKAIQIQPNFIDAHINLGVVFDDLGFFEKALNCYKKVIQIQPNHAHAYYNQGSVLKKLNKPEEAIKCYQCAIQIEPKYADAHNNIGVILKEMGKNNEAINSYEQAIQIQPNHAGSNYNLGLIYRSLNDYKNAVSFLGKTIKIQPNHGDALLNLALSYKELGQFEKAIKFHKIAIEKKPGNLDFYYHLSTLKKEILNKSLRRIIEEILKKKDSTKINIAFGNYLLSFYERKKKNYKKELDYLKNGHFYYFETKKEQFEKEIFYWVNTLPKIIQLIESYETKNENNKIKPIFIVGVPRTGSTLIEKIIGSGPEKVRIGEETGIIAAEIKKKIFLDKSQKFNLKDLQIKIEERYKEKELIQKGTNNIFTDKSLDNFFYIDLIKKIFPNAKIINCKRDVVSSIMSIYQHNLTDLAWGHNLENIFKYFNNYFEVIKNFKEKYPNYIYDLQYEKFVADPDVESKKLMKFCELNWSKNCLEFYKRKDLISKTSSNSQIREPIYQKSMAKYLPYKELLNTYGNKHYWYN